MQAHLENNQIQFPNICISRNNGSVRLAFGDPVGLAHGDRATPFWIRSRRGGTGGRLRCGICRGSGSGFLRCARGEDPGEVTGEFCLSLHFKIEKTPKQTTIYLMIKYTTSISWLKHLILVRYLLTAIYHNGHPAALWINRQDTCSSHSYWKRSLQVILPQN